MRKVFTWFLMSVFLLCTPALSPAKLAPGDFIDISGHWAESEIQTACHLGLLSGVGTTAQGFKIFKPEDTVSRAQLVSVLSRTFKLDYGKIRFIKAPMASDYFQNADDKAWYSGALVLCVINGVLDDAECFNPGESVSRLEVARAIGRSFKARNISVPMIMMMPYYDDTGSLTDEDRNAVTFVSNTGIMKGNGQSFRPGDPVKRAELARILNRCVQLTALNQDSNGQEYAVPVGQTFILSLNSNPSTGFQWNPGSWNEKVVSLTSRNFENSDNKAVIGQGGRESFLFTALKPGSTEIKLNYARPWESVQPQQTYTLRVKVISPTDNTSLQMSMKSVKSKNELIDVDFNIPQMSGLKNEKVQAGINRQFLQDADELRASIEGQAREYQEESKRYGISDEPFRPYGVWSGCSKYYENENMLSLYVDYYNYTGGAHGLTERRAYNYNLQTGERLELKNLFQPDFDYKIIIDEQVKNKIAARPDYYFDGDMGFKGINEKNFYIENDSLVLYFNQYEIAPYAAGIPEFRLPLSMFGDNLSVN